MLQIHWIFKSRGDTLTPPPSDFTTNPRNQAVSAIINVLSFKRFGWNSIVLKCDHRLCESPATPKNGGWVSILAKIPLLLQMIQFIVVTRKLFQIQWKNWNRRAHLRHPPNHFQTKPLQTDQLSPDQMSHFQYVFDVHLSKISFELLADCSINSSVIPNRFSIHIRECVTTFWWLNVVVSHL